MAASPQLEHGYIRIANELLEALIRGDFTIRELKVMMAVIRLTYGYQRKSARISLSRLHVLTNVDRAHVSRVISRLVSRKVLLKEQHPGFQVLGINKNYSEWSGLPKEQPQGGLPKEQRGVAHGSNKSVAHGSNTIKTKDSNKNIPPVIPPAEKPAEFELEAPTPEPARQPPVNGKALTYPPWLPLELWEQFRQVRREIRKPLKPSMEARLISKLTRLRAEGYDVRPIIQRSVDNSYQGLFERDEDLTHEPSQRPSRGYRTGAQRVEDANRAIAEGRATSSGLRVIDGEGG